ncbi:hypothetical protein GCM10018954_080420 [Kutzneria kofuensis]
MASSASPGRSPAEAYAASKRRAARPRLTDFVSVLSFELDPFQREACEALEDGHGVLVCAPTGAGKTVVGEFAVHLALGQGAKCFYTTPIKALSNQKFADLTARYGADKVGLLTGDSSINGDSPVVVMTTEVLRNMLYAGSSTLDNLAFVVMDEIHYLADRFRGAVWEEVILHLPETVKVVGLSATVSNAEEFGEWLVEVRGDTAVVVDEHRPVPLWQHMMLGGRVIDLFADDGGNEARINPTLLRRAEELGRHHVPFSHGRGPRAARARGGGPRFRPPSRVDVVGRLEQAGLLPAIDFVFSRAGCEAAVTQCVRAGMRLTSPEDVEVIRGIIDERTKDLPEGDLMVLGYWEWREALERGIASHHAGLLPAFKETVEELFVRGLVKVVFATETLALGINMPARTVVLEKLVKYNGEAHVDLTPGEYTQLTGRAGRRGIDVEGHAVVVWQPGIDPKQVGGLASTRTYPLRSSFRPGYNMAVNLVHQVGAQAAREMLEQSFAQFQADRSVVGLARRIERGKEALAGYAKSMTCHLGDFSEYAELRRKLTDREKALSRQNSATRRAAAAESLERLRKGDVIAVPSGRRSGIAVVIDPGLDPLGEPRPFVLTEDRWAGTLSVADFPPRWRHWVGCGCRRTSTGGLRASAGTWPPASVRRGSPRRTGRAAAVGPTRMTTSSWRRCAGPCVPTRATGAATGRRTPAGPSATTGCWPRPSASNARSRPPRTPWPGRSTASAACSGSAATWRPTATASRRTAVGWPACTASRTCWRRSACGTASGRA